jgi:hypothetical protein
MGGNFELGTFWVFSDADLNEALLGFDKMGPHTTRTTMVFLK